MGCTASLHLRSLLRVETHCRTSSRLYAQWNKLCKCLWSAEYQNKLKEKQPFVAYWNKLEVASLLHIRTNCRSIQFAAHWNKLQKQLVCFTLEQTIDVVSLLHIGTNYSSSQFVSHWSKLQTQLLTLMHLYSVLRVETHYRKSSRLFCVIEQFVQVSVVC